jgi:hypothetical protein
MASRAAGGHDCRHLAGGVVTIRKPEIRHLGAGTGDAVNLRVFAAIQGGSIMRRLLSFLSAAALVAGLAGIASAGSELSPDDIRTVVRAHSHEIGACYKKHAMNQDDATGEVTLSMVVTSAGLVNPDSLEIEAPGVTGKKFPRCVEKSVSEWKFPTSDGETELQLPFLFQHTRAPGAGPTS